jgi:hypothetical protein
MEKSDAAKILNVGVEATVEEVHRAFKVRSKKHHPDSEGGSHDAFLKLQLAQDVLLGKDTPKAERSQAMAEFMQAFQSVIGRAKDPLKVDLIANTRMVLSQLVQQQQNQIANIIKDLEVTRGILARLVCKTENDPITVMINQHIAGSENALITTRVKIENIEEAMRIADQYKYNADKPETNFSGGSWTSFNIIFPGGS